MKGARLLFRLLLPLLLGTAAMTSCALDPVWQQDDSWGEPIERVQMRLAIAADGAPTFPGDLPTMEVQIRNQGINAVTVNPEALYYALVEIDGVWYSQAFATFGTSMPRVIEPGSQSEMFETYQYVFRMSAINGATPSTPSLELHPGSHRVRLRNLTGPFSVRTIDGRDLSLVSNAVVFSNSEMPETTERVAQLGLTTDVEPERAAVRPGDPLALRVTFRNESANAFRLPHTVSPPAYQLWVLKLRDANTGKTFTGVSAVPMGAAPGAGSIQPQLLAPDAAITTSVSFDSFVFLEGDLKYEEARSIYFPQRLKPRSEFALPVGDYAARVIVRFPGYPDRPDLPADVWKGGEAQSDETRIVVRGDAGP